MRNPKHLRFADNMSVYGLFSGADDGGHVTGTAVVGGRDEDANGVRYSLC